jgi:hypothetical protein
MPRSPASVKGFCGSAFAVMTWPAVSNLNAEANGYWADTTDSENVRSRTKEARQRCMLSP